MAPTSEQITTRYQNLNLKSKRRKNLRFVGLGILIVSFALMIMGSELRDTFVTELEESYPQNAKIIYGLIFGFGILGLMFIGALLLTAGKPIFDKQQKIFYVFYHNCMVLRNFLDLKDSKNNKKTLKEFEKLTWYVGGWADDRAPDIISNFSTTLAKSLETKIIPRIKNNKFDELTPFLEVLTTFSVVLYDRQPSDSNFYSLIGFMNTLQVLPEPKPSKIIQPLEHRSFVAPIFVSGIIIAITYTILSYSELGWGQSLAAALGIGVLVFFRMWKRS